MNLRPGVECICLGVPIWLTAPDRLRSSWLILGAELENNQNTIIIILMTLKMMGEKRRTLEDDMSNNDQVLSFAMPD